MALLLSLQNRPAAVQRSPHNGPSPPCMNPALTNTSWVRERRRRRDGVFPHLFFCCFITLFRDIHPHVGSCLIVSPHSQLYYLNKVFISGTFTLWTSNPFSHIPVMSFTIIILRATFIHWAFCCNNIGFKYKLQLWKP